jgi:hypothetical protein
MSNNEVDISGLSKAAVLAALHNNAKVFGAGRLQAVQGDLAVADVQSFLDDGDDRNRMFMGVESEGSGRSSLNFQYFMGRLLYVDLSSDTIHTDAFDRQYGKGAGQWVIDHLRETGSVERILPGHAFDQLA